MKLLKLNLSAVGPFTGVVLDLSAGKEGLHLIYGPNEAGKTSALRAVSYLLFGFPQRSADNFVHPNDQLRVGGTLRHKDGDEVELIRRRGNKNTLRGPDDSLVVSADLLKHFVGEMSQSSFETLFGIDHERLSLAGDEIRTGKGRLGELLFAAGAGLSGLRKAQQTLQKELDELFRPRVQKHARITRILAEIDTDQKKLKQLQLPSESWVDQDRAFREAMHDSERLRDQIRTARLEQGKLKRKKSAIPVVAHRHRLKGELTGLGDVIRLREDFGTELRGMHEQKLLAQNTIDKARVAIEALVARLAPLNPSQRLLDEAGEIESLQERLGAVEKASRDRAQLEIYHSDREHRARQILRELGRSPDLSEAESLRLRADEPLFIRAMGQRFAELRGQADAARKAISRHGDQIARYDQQLTELDKPRDVESLRRTIRQARKAGDLDTRLATARGELAPIEQRTDVALAQLPGWRQPIEALRRLAVPLFATVDQFESRIQEIAQKRQALAERLSKENDSILECQASLQSLTLQQDVPTEDAVAKARSHRDEGWRLIKASWLERAPDNEHTAAFVAAFAPGGTLAAAFEESVQRADAMSDRLRREADRVAKSAALVAALEKHRAAHAKLEQACQAVEEDQHAIDRDWNELVAPLGLSTGASTPNELRAWLRRREEIVQVYDLADEHRQRVVPLEAMLATHRRALAQALEPLGISPGTASVNLVEALENAEALIKQQDDLVQKRIQLENKLADAKAEEANARLSLQSAETELSRWHRDWSQKMSRIGLEAEAAPEQAEIILAGIAELLKLLDERHDFQLRLSGIDRDARLFEKDVAQLTERVAPDLSDRPAAEQARELAARLRSAQADAKEAAALSEQKRREQTNLRAAETKLEEAQVSLERLRQEANCKDFSQLPEAERRSQNRVRLETELATATEQLMTIAAGDDLEAFATRVERADSNALSAAIEELDGQIAARDDELRGIEQKIGAARAALTQMSGGADAAETAENIQNSLVGLQKDVARFATLKLAEAVLKRGIERYREKNQGAILTRAGSLFATLTSGSFTRLTIDDDDGTLVLKGIRPDGRLVGVEGMSDGSHDQLYLALRLASLESWLQSHEPIPFIVDDILLNFDDQRAAAALGALAELSRKTQVLFFTHHRHLVDLARTQLPHDLVFIHELPGMNTPES
jgi:uncharacterized protein YhaN